MIHVTTDDAQALAAQCDLAGPEVPHDARARLTECAAMIESLAKQRDALMTALRNLCESECSDPYKGRTAEGRWMSLLVRAHHAHEAVALLQ